MSLSNALSNALSGIAAASRGTEVVASNLANALTPGFARRELQTSSRTHISGGGGVFVDGVTRAVRTGVLAQGRIATAETNRAQTLAAFHTALAETFGVPGEAGALTTQLSAFHGALTAAAARPDNEVGLARVVTSAQTLASKINQIGTQIQDARTAADTEIAADVRTLNAGLARVVELNRQITVQLTSGDDATALQDERQRVIDSIGQVVPLQELPRDGGRVALFTTSGQVLLDGFTPVTLDFTASGPLGPGMQVGSPPLGRLVVDGKEQTAGQMSLFDGGRLAANFQIRDRDAPAAQAQIDALARDLIDRLSAPSVDPTTTGPGLLADAGNAFDPAAERGLAQRLALNALVDPARNGEARLVRDGLGATVPGPAGDAALLDRMRVALTSPRQSASPALTPAARTVADLAAEVTSFAAMGRLDAEATLGGATARSDSFDQLMRQDGVDSDREMEQLLALQRAYASNAKVLAAVDDMIQTILRMT